MIYYTFAGYFALLAALGEFGARKRRASLGFWLGAVALLLAGALRFEVGADWPAYLRIFDGLNTPSDVWAAREEKLFLLAMWASKLLVPSYPVFVAVAFTISYVTKLSTISKLSLNRSLSLLVYLYTVFIIYDTNGLRYGLAISCVFLAIPFVLRRRPVGFLLLVTLATGFHLSAVIAYPLYWVAHVRVRRITILAAVASAIGVGAALRDIFASRLAEVLSQVAALNHYMVYLVDVGTGREQELLGAAGIQRAVTLGLALFVMKTDDERGDIQRLLVNGYALSVVLFCLFAFSGEFATRMSFYFKALEILLIPEIVATQRSVGARIALVGLYSIMAFLAIGRLLDLPNGALLPYQTVLGELGWLGE